MTAAHWVAFFVRLGIVILFFPASALDKTLNFQGAVGQASEIFKPILLARLVIVAGLFTEIVMPLGILTGVADRLAAFMLAGYCAVTAVLFKQFWRPGDFWAKGASKARDLFWDCLKNFSLAAGFLLITVQPDGSGLRAFLTAPLASSHPYAAETIHHD